MRIMLSCLVYYLLDGFPETAVMQLHIGFYLLKMVIVNGYMS